MNQGLEFTDDKLILLSSEGGEVTEVVEKVILGDYPTLQSFYNQIGADSNAQVDMGESEELPYQVGDAIGGFILTSIGEQQQEGNIITIKTFWSYREQITTVRTTNELQKRYRTRLNVSKDNLSTSVPLFVLKKYAPKITTEENTVSNSLQVYFKFQIEEEVPPQDPVPEVEIVDIGAFPFGIGSEYCQLLCFQDDDYCAKFLDNKIILDTWAKDYIDKMDGTERTGTFFGRDSQGLYILKRVNSSDESYTNERIEDVYHNECYKIYLSGKCQMISFNSQAFMNDYSQGQDQFDLLGLPIGYYIKIGTELRLFLLDSVKPAYGLNAAKTQIKNFVYNEDNYSSSNFKTLTLENINNPIIKNGIYLYIGKEGQVDIPQTLEQYNNFFLLDKNNSFSNLRKLILADSITDVTRMGNVQNPTQGVYFSKSLKYLGDYAVNTNSFTRIVLESPELKYIGKYVFGENPGNAKVYIGTEYRDNEDQLGKVWLPIGVEYIGDNAFSNLPITVFSSSSCTKINYIGYRAFAFANNCKNIEIRENQINKTDNSLLIDLPLEITSYILNQLSDNINSCTYNTGSKESFGNNLGGWFLMIKS